VADATVDFSGVRGAGFDDALHWLECGLHWFVLVDGVNLARPFDFGKK
jgi:hypothetical protein